MVCPMLAQPKWKQGNCNLGLVFLLEIPHLTVLGTSVKVEHLQAADSGLNNILDLNGEALSTAAWAQLESAVTTKGGLSQ